MTKRADIGIIGLGVMGRNLALNLADHGFGVMVFDQWAEARTAFTSAEGHDDAHIPVSETLSDLVDGLAQPRTVLLLVKAGATVDEHVTLLLPLLTSGDVIIDGGNSHYRDTVRRASALRERDIGYLGIGISGGEAGARHGASLMIGGDHTAFRRLEPLLTAVAAKVDGTPCCAYLGSDGAGHFVKTMHNGIEYADMQIIAEAYLILREVAGLSHPEMAEVFAAWSDGALDSFLIEITRDILKRSDPESGQPLVEMIRDRAGQKGTGQWAAVAALELGIPAPTIIAAVQARSISAVRDEPTDSAAGPPSSIERPSFIEALGQALLAARICAYVQGLSVIEAGAQEHEWDLNTARLLQAWRAGSIIRARLLEPIRQAYGDGAKASTLLMAPQLRSTVEHGLPALRRVLGEATAYGVPVPALASALAYADAWRGARLGTNLIQAQRDCFGAHGYERADRPGRFHTDWTAR